LIIEIWSGDGPPIFAIRASNSWIKKIFLSKRRLRVNIFWVLLYDRINWFHWLLTMLKPRLLPVRRHHKRWFHKIRWLFGRLYLHQLTTSIIVQLLELCIWWSILVHLFRNTKWAWDIHCLNKTGVLRILIRRFVVRLHIWSRVVKNILASPNGLMTVLNSMQNLFCVEVPGSGSVHYWVLLPWNTLVIRTISILFDGLLCETVGGLLELLETFKPVC
jgi:hypothetical protein